MPKLVVDEEESSRKVLLEQAEARIYSAFRRGMSATREIARELIAIKEGNLFLESQYQSFNTYTNERLRIDPRSANRIMEVHKTMSLLEESDEPFLPDNESQAAELIKLPLEKRLQTWRDVVQTCEQEEIPITVGIVRDAVELAAKEAEETTTKPPPRRPRSIPAPATEEEEEKGLDIDIDKDEEDPESQKRVSLTEDGERALDRIRRLCGDSVATAIETGTVSMTESNLVRWADEDDVVVKNLAYYIVDLRWTLGKAMEYESRSVNGRTTIDDLMTLATARGGRVSVHHQDFRFTVERLANAAAA